MTDKIKTILNTKKMSKSKDAVKYFISVKDEVTGKRWRDRPDHVEKKFLEAESEISKKRIEENTSREPIFPTSPVDQINDIINETFPK